jgi:hypothetical protein
VSAAIRVSLGEPQTHPPGHLDYDGKPFLDQGPVRAAKPLDILGRRASAQAQTARDALLVSDLLDRLGGMQTRRVAENQQSQQCLRRLPIRCAAGSAEPRTPSPGNGIKYQRQQVVPPDPSISELVNQGGLLHDSLDLGPASPAGVR